MQVEHTADRFGGAWLKSEPMQGQNLEEGRYVGVSRTSVIAHVYPEMSISSIICSSQIILDYRHKTKVKHPAASDFSRQNGAYTQDGFIHIAASGWISVNTEEKKNKHYIQKVKNQ